MNVFTHQFFMIVFVLFNLIQFNQGMTCNTAYTPQGSNAGACGPCKQSLATWWSPSVISNAYTLLMLDDLQPAAKGSLWALDAQVPNGSPRCDEYGPGNTYAYVCKSSGVPDVYCNGIRNQMDIWVKNDDWPDFRRAANEMRGLGSNVISEIVRSIQRCPERDILIDESK
ncbi:hypothetical protein DFH28DRAFT_1107962 [Melampsora americana]|nr:hypothetical protein DFH28DRAFT_1107962 [Melampsora americana]